MNEYGLGIELSPSTVRWVTATGITDVGETRAVAPRAIVVAGRLIAGAAATGEHDRPASVDDVVGQFTVDRLWFVDGMMITPDDAMRALVAGVVADAVTTAGAPPGAVTIACPSDWEPPALARLSQIVDALALAQARATGPMTAAAAAVDATGRLPERRPVDVAVGDLPLLPASARSGRVRQPETSPASVVRRVERRRRRGWIAWLALVIGIPVVLIIVVQLTHEDSADIVPAATPAPTTPPPTDHPSSSTEPPLAPLTLALVSAGDPAVERQVHEAVADVAGRAALAIDDVFLVVQPVPENVADVVTQIRRQGAAAILTDVSGPPLDALLAAANAAGMATCVVRPATSPADTLPVPAAASGASGCTNLLALVALAAGSTEPRGMLDALREMATNDGTECPTFAQCAAYIAGDVPISYQPPGEPIVLAGH